MTNGHENTDAESLPRVLVSPSAESWAEFAAEQVVDRVTQAIAARGRCLLVLAGGSTPESLYRRLAVADRDRVDWKRVDFFLGDERLVPHDDARSNDAMARRSLLDPLRISATQVHSVDTRGTAGEAAEAYRKMLESTVPGCTSVVPPRFDLLLLGLGSDGHIASLFPGKPALEAVSTWVAPSPPGELPPPVDRVTLTFPAINAARSVLMLVTGDSKAHVVARVLQERPAVRECPACGVKPTDGESVWILDPPAAAKLDQHRIKQ